MKCNRCHNSNRMLFKKIYCPNCIECYYCIKCAHISIFKLCDKLKNNLIFEFETLTLKLEYNLTENQKLLTKLIKQNQEKNIFINATCGAGKTEIVFNVVKDYINEQKQVCFVCPRVEVIHELYLRFNKVFNTTFGIITGEIKNYSGSMFFMTCNQLINYQNTFDLVIVDEADAFPLSNDIVLSNAIDNSIKKSGRIIKMSATPLKIDKSYLTLNLFERYHKQPIPIPTYKKHSDKYIKELISGNRWIVFFPTIKLLNEVYQKYSEYQIIICHSKITNVSEKLCSLKENFIIFSTAILERGITISNVNVIVYDAHHNNFDASTLIQISGRVGRVAPFTDGQVIFMGKYKTKAIVNTIKYIEALND